MSQNYVQKATGASPSGLTDSQVFDNGTNVGVGTATPAAKVDVVGNISDDGVVINVTNTNAGVDAWSGLQLSNDVGTIGYASVGSDAAGGRFVLESTADSSGLDLTALAGEIRAFTGGNERLRVESGGAVAIGTTSAGAKLHVASSVTTAALFESDATAETYGGITIKHDKSGGQPIIRFHSGSTEVGAIYWDSSPDALRVQNGSFTVPDGNVGIGTGAPTAALSFGSASTINTLAGSLTLAPYDVLVSTKDFYANAAIKHNAESDLGIAVTSNAGMEFSTNDTGRMYITNGGNVGISTTGPTARLDVNSDVIRLRTAKTPASASATGNEGDFAWDANYFYMCVASNTWRRVAHSSW